MQLIARVCVALFLFAAPAAAKHEEVAFESEDGLKVTADLYALEDESAPFIVLFHQAGWSRGEYREIAPRLNEMGFACLAVDQRSGGKTAGVKNETAARAKEEELATEYLDAIPDMRAAVAYVRKEHAEGQVLVWGSSYSAALVLRLAGTEEGFADGVLAFAPGEYFTRAGKSETFVREGAAKVQVPVFITSARKEKPYWKGIFDAIPHDRASAFLPETEGNHGSRALWEEFDDSEDYWDAVTKFLDEHFPRGAKAVEARSKKKD